MIGEQLVERRDEPRVFDVEIVEVFLEKLLGSLARPKPPAFLNWFVGGIDQNIDAARAKKFSNVVGEIGATRFDDSHSQPVVADIGFPEVVERPGKRPQPATLLEFDLRSLGWRTRFEIDEGYRLLSIWTVSYTHLTLPTIYSV